MAILKKRTSSRQLPEARGVERAPLDSIIRGVGNAPSISGGRPSSITSAGGAGGSNAITASGGSGRPFTSTFTNPATTKPTLTSKTSSTPKTTLAPKTSLTTKTSSTPKTTLAPKTTLTSKTTPTTKPTITNKTTTTPTTKTTTGTNTVKPTVKPNISNPNSTTSKVVNALTGAAIGAGTKLLIDKITGKPTVVKTGSGGAGTTGGTKPSTGGTSTAGGTKPPAGGTKPSTGGTTSVVKPPVINTSTGNPSGTGFGDDAEEYTTDSLGNVYKTMPDGTSVLYRAAEVDEDIESGGATTGSADTGDTTVADNAGVEYFQDDYGNIYTMNEDGSYELYSGVDGGTGSDSDYADNTYVDPDTGQTWTLAEDGTWHSDEDTSYADNTYTDPDTGALYVLGDNGEWTTDWTDDTDYSLYADDTDYSDYTMADNNDYYDYGDYYDDEEYAKRGGLITMMKQGGVAKFEDGGYVDNGDGTYTIGNFTYDMETDEYLYSTDPETGNISNVSPDAVYSTTAQDDYYDTDSLGNIFKNGELYRAAEVPEDITSAGGGSRTPTLGNYLNKGVDTFKGLVGGGYDALTGALGTTAGAAGAGALVATLLGQDFSGGTGNQNQGLDMSKVGVINPRTTDFGIGPTNFVGYEDYGTSGDDYTPNEELLRNLNAPGYNPVNEGDYGYEELAADEAESIPKMASGGLSSMATPVASYYTFGQPADILANLGMRQQPPMNPPEMMPQIGQQQPPQMAQQQGLPQQMPPQMAQQTPQGMPQQGIMPQQQGMAPPMRKGGLPHVSNVPMTQGRMDFRKGSAVHGDGDGQSDDIPAMLADGEYVIDSETVAQIGNGSTKAGAQALDKFRENIRAHKRSAPINKIPPKTKALTSYLKGAK